METHMHIKDWKGKWVLVTGGSERVGAGVSEYFAARGFNIIAHARTDRPALHTFKARIEQEYGVQVELVVGELTSEEDVKAIFAKHSPDVVVNNAAVFKKDDTEANIAANKQAPLLVTQEAIARMRADKKSGVVFFVGDAFLARGGVYSKDLAGYTLSKVWIPEEVKKLAPLNKEGIRVLAILNGPIEPPPTASPEAVAAIRKEINMPDEELKPWIGGWKVGEAIYGLLIAEAISGTCVLVDGGRQVTGTAPNEH
jgi:NAD(P)-dependent dehydrogenase (short-subunit alcohol dehydrogenase family)